MKKQIIAGIASALMVGAVATTSFAAANPFSDVPKDHWAYDAVTELAKDGVIEGYGDGTYRGEQNITRYEMAQMVAKAMANEKPDTSIRDKQLLSRLASEFADELNNLGVRVSNLERNADMVKWTGELRYSYTNNRPDSNALIKANEKINNNLEFRINHTAEINKNVHVAARLTAFTDLKNDRSDGVSLNQVFASGKTGVFGIKAGKVGTEDKTGLVFDSDYDSFSGGTVSATKGNVTAYGGGGRMSMANDSYVRNRTLGDTASYQFAGAQYDNGKVSVGGAYHHLNSDTLSSYSTSKGDVDIWTANVGYKINDNVKFSSSYAENANVDKGEKAYNLQLNYKGANALNKGSWGVYVGYRHLGEGVSLSPMFSGMSAGEKGYVFGGEYTLFRNVVASGNYFNGKVANLSGNDNASSIFGRVQFLF